MNMDEYAMGRTGGCGDASNTVKAGVRVEAATEEVARVAVAAAAARVALVAEEELAGAAAAGTQSRNRATKSRTVLGHRLSARGSWPSCRSTTRRYPHCLAAFAMVILMLTTMPSQQWQR